MAQNNFFCVQSNHSVILNEMKVHELGPAHNSLDKHHRSVMNINLMKYLILHFAVLDIIFLNFIILALSNISLILSHRSDIFQKEINQGILIIENLSELQDFQVIVLRQYLRLSL